MTKISQLSSIGDSLAIGDQFLIRDIDDTGSPNKSVTVSGITRALDVGTALAPAIAFATDKNTGIYSPGADQLAVATNGTGRLFVDAAGNVGVGVGSPVTALQVVGVATFGNGAGGRLQATTDSNLGYIDSLNNTSTQWQPLIQRATEIVLCTNTAGVTPVEKVRITSAGLVGIGTTSPGSALEINAAAATSPFIAKINTAESARIDSSGRLLVGTSSATGANLLQVNTDALVNGLTVGRGASAINSNTAVGASALAANTTGGNNTANGRDALLSNTTGNFNTANGRNALYSNTTGSNNTANGLQALFSNTTGIQNTANGVSALLSNTTGSSNTANGVSAILSNTTGSSNTANGVSALQSNTTGSNNTANGLQALLSNTTGNSNTANGVFALPSNTTGSNNTANGLQALFSNTTGIQNTANGVSALYSNTTGYSNTAIGLEAGYGDGTQANTTGINNTFIGVGAMGASATASNVITLGNGSIATLRCQVTTITSLSDARDKTNITNLPAGLDFINALRPVAFDWNTRDGKKVGIPEFGFIAQELQDAQASTGITVPNLVSAENPDKLEASAGTLLPVLVNAVQELTAMVRDLQTELSILKGA